MDLQIRVECQECNKELEGTVHYSWRGVEIEVKPCPDCLEAERDEGHSEGYEAGLADTKKEEEPTNG